MGLYLIDNYPRPCYTLADFVDRNYALGKVLSHVSDSLKSAMAIPGKSIVKVVVENSGIISITSNGEPVVRSHEERRSQMPIVLLDSNVKFPRCKGCKFHGRQTVSGSLCWSCSRYHRDEYVDALTETKISEPVIGTASPVRRFDKYPPWGRGEG